jgi:uncharacterized protein (DUF2141 family)
MMGAAPSGTLDLGIFGLRSARGLVQICVTTQATHFPDCRKDANARRLTVTADKAASLDFSDLPAGDYAVALIHDENGNGKLDTFMGIPREGFGFSRNPAIRFGAPSFSSAEFKITSGAVAQQVKMKYML